MEIITIKVKNSSDALKIMELLKKQNIEAVISKKKTSTKTTKKDTVTKEKFLKDLKEGLKEVKEIQEGKRKKNTMKDFNDYVQS
jgi:hypothetical protein